MTKVETAALRERALELVRRYPSLSYRVLARRLGCQTDYVGHVAREAGLVKKHRLESGK